MKTAMFISTILSSILLHPNSAFATLNYAFEYPMSVTVQEGPAEFSHFEYCKVASFVDSESGLRYYQTFFYPVSTPPFGASRNTGVGTYTPNKFSYMDESFLMISGKIVATRSYTDYTLDPSNGRVLQVELRSLDSSGNVLNRHVCQNKDLSS